LLRAVAGCFVPQGRYRADGLPFERHAAELRQRADMPNAAVREAWGYFPHRLSALLLDLAQLLSEVLDVFLDHAGAECTGKHKRLISPSALLVSLGQAVQQVDDLEEQGVVYRPLASG